MKLSSRPCVHSAYTRAHTPKITLNVLIACEEFQAECRAFRELGHHAYSCDIQPCRKDGNTSWHIMGDVTPLLSGETSFVTMDGVAHWIHQWDIIICHPPCTFLCKIGSPWLYKNPDKNIYNNGKLLHVNAARYKKMLRARTFFYRCLNATARYVAVENSIPMKLADLPPADAFACPSWFGVKYTKKTLYWLKNLPPIIAEYIHSSPKCYVKSSRGKYRSRTFPELAQAIAKQWSEFVITEMSNELYR